jgi:exodeoxyribonuclease V gamma subunit
MLKLHFSNRFETLADELVDRLGARAPDRPVFAADQVIVPSAAITRRLIIELARRHGVCANVQFSYLASWLWEHGKNLMPALPTTSPVDASVLAWRILAAFSDDDWAPRQPRLAAWLARADAVMRHELAQRVAALFDQYLTYRPDWLEAWTTGGIVDVGSADPGAASDQQWQASLWRRLSRETGTDGRHPFLDLLKAMDERGLGLAGTGALPAAAHVFCPPTMPPVHLELLQRLGQHVDLHLYVLNPSREFWFDIVEHRRLAWLALRGEQSLHEEGNRLLAAWGQQTKSQLSLLVDAADTALVGDAGFVASDSATLLGALQNAVLDLADLAPGSVRLSADDRSIEVHVCHSMTRELEVLHDRLLAIFAGPNPPSPGDVLVVTPDLDAAAPLIDAVFGTAPARRHLPYTITGRARAQVNAPARALLDLLALAGSRFVVSEVFGLLQQASIARRFGIDADDLDQIRDWLARAGVHWALDAEHRASFGVPGQQRHSFADGLDRLFLGYALPSHLQAPFQARLPAGDAEGSAALTLGAFWRFVDALAALRARVATPQPPSAWPGLLATCLATFIAPEDADLEDLREVNEALEKLDAQWRQSALAQPLPLDVVRAALEQVLDDPARGGVPTGMITFAAMSSLRNVPFRIVCAIGLNDGAFPTSARPSEFDLMQPRPRRGDRQRRVDERNVFLDLLLAARDVVHLSYAGRSVRDNSVLPPSVLVSELVEYLVPAIALAPGDAAASARARLVVDHPLQPFAQAAFELGSDPRVRSFNGEYADALRQSLERVVAHPLTADAADDDWLDADDGDDRDASSSATTPFLSRPLPPPGAEWRDVPIDRLAAFFRNPCRFLLEKRLGIELRRDEDELQDDEPFLPDVHGRAPLIDLLLPRLLEGLPLDDARTLALAGIDVPMGGFGQRFLERELNGLQDFATQVREFSRQPVLEPRSVECTFVIAGQTWRVHAAFAELRSGGLLRHRYAKQGPRDYLDAWLPHLMLCAAAPPDVAFMATTGISRDGRWYLDECPDPLAALERLVGLYVRGLREPLSFFPKAAWAYLESDDNLSKAEAVFRPASFALFPSEGEDAGYQLALRGRPNPFAPHASGEFVDCAHAVFDPLRASLKFD